MTDLTSNETRRRLIDEGYRLHMAIVEWGFRHGVRAYRVVPDVGESFFEIYDPKSKSISRDFPAKIKRAIESHAAELAAYAEWSRSFDRTPPGLGSFAAPQIFAPDRGNSHGCDCNGDKRSASPIKHGADVVLAAGSAQMDPAASGDAKRRKVDFRL